MKTKNLYVELKSQFHKDNHANYILSVAGALLSGMMCMGISWILGELLDTASGKGNYSIMELLWISWGVALFFLLASFLNYYAKPRYVKKAMQNYKEDDNNYRKENYIAIPVLFNYGIELVDGIKVVPYLGPTFSYGISGVVAGGATAFGITVSTGEVNLYGDNSTYAPFY